MLKIFKRRWHKVNQLILSISILFVVFNRTQAKTRTTLELPYKNLISTRYTKPRRHDQVYFPAISGGASSINDSASEKSNDWHTSFGDFGPYLIREFRKGAGVTISSVGFITSVIINLCTDKAQFRRIKPTVKSLDHFLQKSGIDVEISKAVSSRLLENLVILGRIQFAALNGKDRRDLAEFGAFKQKPSNIPSTEEALRYMKYATAAYGSAMINAAEIERKGKIDGRLAPVTRQRISEHIGVPEEDIILLDVDYGATSKYLRHFVACDHKNKAVVVSVRGSFSISDIVVDIAGFTRHFCGGEAHSEIANQAEAIWSVSGGTIKSILAENKDYDLVFTGHSLGAGAACLLNILCHCKERKLVRGRTVRCYSFASPPVFSSLRVVPKAVQTTVNYIHENDVVPFLSVDSIRRAIASICIIDSQKIRWVKRNRILLGYGKPDKHLIDNIQRSISTRPKPKEGAPILFIPAAATGWMYEKHSKRGKYDIKFCDPTQIAILGIYIHLNMLNDHLPPRYEHALNNLV